jgi:hypothetical protein
MPFYAALLAHRFAATSASHIYNGSISEEGMGWIMLSRSAVLTTSVSLDSPPFAFISNRPVFTDS